MIIVKTSMIQKVYKSYIYVIFVFFIDVGFLKGREDQYYYTVYKT
jgi:hypothetical protein